ncbi:MAG: ATP-binding protein [Oscillospiraceae bacterium]|nr:ATP-binding protein [Oscillospiraceae bacterium]
MAEQFLSMSAKAIAKTVGTVGSPLVVISELIKNAVDASATEINIFYDAEGRTITVRNNHKGFSHADIALLHEPGVSNKKTGENLQNEAGMFLTGSKGLGLLSVFLLSQTAEIKTVTEDHCVYIIRLNKENGSVDSTVTQEKSEDFYTEVILKDVDYEIIALLSSESEIKKLRHICTYLYKPELPFPNMLLNIKGQGKTQINFTCPFPNMLFDVNFHYNKYTQQITFQCISPAKTVNEDEIVFSDFSLEALQDKMRTAYKIKDTIPTRTNETPMVSFEDVPSFEGRILVYEKKLAGERLKTYGAGVNIYVNEYALYNYLAEENDWLGLADYSQRKKVTRLKPHNVFGYVNFPEFDESTEKLKISNERADFIQDMTFRKLMYLIKGVIMFAIFNIDVADKNPKYKEHDKEPETGDEGENVEVEDTTTPAQQDSQNSSSDDGGYGTTRFDSAGISSTQENGDDEQPYKPEEAYAPTPNARRCLEFTSSEGKVIAALKGTDNLGDKIYGLVFELSRLETDKHRYAVTCLYRSLIESATKKFASKYNQVSLESNNLEASVICALNYLGNQIGKNPNVSDKKIKQCRETVKKSKIIDILNEYIHNETVPDAFKIQESWNTMKEYIMMCLLA